MGDAINSCNFLTLPHLLLLLLLLQVTVLTPTGAELQLSVPTAAGPGGQDFGAEQLAELALEAVSQQA